MNKLFFKTCNFQIIFSQKKFFHISVFFLIIILSLTNIFYQSSLKYSLHVDEPWAYGLANSYIQPLLCNIGQYNELENGGYNRWLTSEDFRNYITVQNDEKFSYDKVFYNQSMDSHPPLFYVLLNTVSSFFPNVFSKWFALSINIFFFFISQVILYFIALKLFKSKNYSLLTLLLWSFSIGAVSTCVFMRMYMVATCFSLALILIGLNIITSEKLSYLHLIVNIITGVLGMLTHNYFYILAFFSTLSFSNALLLKRRYIDALKYAISMLLSLIGALLIFPEEIQLITKSDKGLQALDQIKSIFFKQESLSLFYGSFINNYFGIDMYTASNIGDLIWLSIYILIVVLFIIILKKKYKHENIRLLIKMYLKKIILFINNNIDFSSLLLIIILYSFIVSKIAPDMGIYQDRYYYMVMPYMSIFIIAFFKKIVIKKIKCKYKLSLIYLIVIFMISLNLFAKNNYVEKKDELNYLFNKSVSESVCFYFDLEPFMIHGVSDSFINSKKVYYTTCTDYTDDLFNQIKGIDNTDKNILIINIQTPNSSDLLSKIEKQGNCDLEYIGEGSHFTNYYIYNIHSK